MTFPTTNATQELPAINEILASVGQAPVNTLDQTNPDVAIAYDTLTRVSRGIQAEGWNFNTEEYLEVALNANQQTIGGVTTNTEYEIPNNVLQCDLHAEVDNQYESVWRVKTDDVEKKPRLYEKINHTFDWYTLTGKTTLNVDVMYYYDWVEIPKVIQDYMVARAATLVSSRIVGDTTQYRMLAEKELYNRAQALEYECRQGDYTFFGHQRGKKPYDSYQPYQALYR